MLLASLIIIYVASGLLGITTIFIKKKGALYFSISALTIICLVVAGILTANYNNYFGGFSIISIISIFPIFLSLFELKPKEIVEEENIENTTQNFDTEIEEINKNNKKKKKEKKKYNFPKSFAESEGRIFEGVAFLLSSFLFAFAGLYLGKETPFGFLMAIPFALIGLCITFMRKNHNFYDVISNIFCFVSAGFLVGQIITVLIYSFALSNILYAIASLIFASYIIATTFTKERRINILMYVSFILLCLSILFL